MDFILAERRSPTLHDFPYRGPARKCYHKWIINVTPPGKAHCIHGCLYCYARDAVYSRSSDRCMRVYGNLSQVVERELSALELCPPVSISNVTDPCQAVPELRRVVRELVEVLVRWGVSFHLITKGDPSFLDAVEGFPGGGFFFLEVTIEGPPEVLRLLSPAAPPYKRRLEALAWAASRGLPAVLRLDPFVPHVWRALYGPGWKERLEGLLRDASLSGARHVVSSTGRFTAATRKALADAVAAHSEHEARSLLEDYRFDRSATSSGYMLPPAGRLDFHRLAGSVSGRLGMTYAVCQELPSSAADSPDLPHCEAFPMPFSRRTGPEEFSPVEGCTANCHVSCAGLDDPPCGRPGLARPDPFTPSMLKPQRQKGKEAP
ncbi:hypothetical protein [Candidatus Solincola sp.]|nr:hypothetical protein [Actinomycetota bacterium]MDI7252371.1 hypothetical protein [Actinomycetota bacterium]